jgi:hypothetical protein
MRWFLLTLALAGACALGAAWIYLRDWERPPASYTEPRDPSATRERALDALAAACPGCRIRRVDRANSDSERIRITTATGSRCFDVDVDTFRDDPQTGIRGVSRVRC